MMSGAVGVKNGIAMLYTPKNAVAQSSMHRKTESNQAGRLTREVWAGLSQLPNAAILHR